MISLDDFTALEVMKVDDCQIEMSRLLYKETVIVFIVAPQSTNPTELMSVNPTLNTKNNIQASRSQNFILFSSQSSKLTGGSCQAGWNQLDTFQAIVLNW